jgi:putative ABC transport system substrate-binding protein
VPKGASWGSLRVNRRVRRLTTQTVSFVLEREVSPRTHPGAFVAVKPGALIGSNAFRMAIGLPTILWRAEMRRREFITGAMAAWPLPALAQQQTKPTVIWFDLRPLPPPEAVEAFRRGLAQVGFSEGRDVTVEYLTADGHAERLPALAAEVVNRRPAAIFAVTNASAPAAKAATQTIPIIFAVGNDPVELGLVASLARPGGNLTGVTSLNAEIATKRLELLHKAVPATQSIALLLGPAEFPNNQVEARLMQSAAGTLGLRLQVINVTADTEMAPIFANLVEQQIGAVAVGTSATVRAKREQIVLLAARYGLPTMFSFSLDARGTGGLLSYGSDNIDVMRQAGAYTGRILKGEKPADLPVVQPTKFEFVINLRTAKALGFQIPTDVLALADEVIE